MNFYEEVYNHLITIPIGTVTTYGDIAIAIGKPKHSRQVGYALHANRNFITVPCHRVVNYQGKLAKSFVFGGISIQKQLLESEGVMIINDKVDLTKYRYIPNIL